VYPVNTQTGAEKFNISPRSLYPPPGADPTATLQRFGELKGWALGSRLHLISLGQGQGPLAESVIKHAAGTGDWVCLQNCHLAASWMARLEEKVRMWLEWPRACRELIVVGRPLTDGVVVVATSVCNRAVPSLHACSKPSCSILCPYPSQIEELASEDGAPHSDFRLWLTSMPSPVFPVSGGHEQQSYSSGLPRPWLASRPAGRVLKGPRFISAALLANRDCSSFTHTPPTPPTFPRHATSSPKRREAHKRGPSRCEGQPGALIPRDEPAAAGFVPCAPRAVATAAVLPVLLPRGRTGGGRPQLLHMGWVFKV
jgi:hypothetical protein